MTSRYLKDLEQRKSKIIHIYRNGDAYTRARFIILRQVEQKDMERIIKAVEEKIKLPQSKAIHKLHRVSGEVITKPVEIEDGEYYVAASTDAFITVDYGHALNWTMVGPVKSNKYANVRYVSRAEELGTIPNRLSTSNSTLQSSKSQNKSSTASKAKNQTSKTRNVKSLKRKEKPSVNKNMTVSEHMDSPISNLNEFNIPQEPVSELKEPSIQNSEDSHQEELQQESKEIEDQLKIQQIEDACKNKEAIQESTPNDAVQELQLGVDITGQQVLDMELEDEHSQQGPIEALDQQHNEENSEEHQSNHLSEELLNDQESKIDDNMDQAATKIQATFRGYKVRSQMARGDEVAEETESHMVMDSLDDNTEANDDSSI